MTGLHLNDSYDPLNNFYGCNPRSIFEGGIWYALQENGIPCGKSDPLNVAKNINELNEAIALCEISYISLGVVRYTKDVYREVKSNYPKSEISNGPYINSFDGKIRYNRPMRNWILNNLKDDLISLGAKPDVIYLCME